VFEPLRTCFTLRRHPRRCWPNRRARRGLSTNFSTTYAAATDHAAKATSDSESLSSFAAYPRVDFKREFTALLVDQASRKPTCPAAEMVAAGMLEEIAQAPFDS
jgi:hypothetical protein